MSRTFLKSEWGLEYSSVADPEVPRAGGAGGGLAAEIDTLVDYTKPSGPGVRIPNEPEQQYAAGRRGAAGRRDLPADQPGGGRPRAGRRDGREAGGGLHRHRAEALSLAVIVSTAD